MPNPAIKIPRPKEVLPSRPQKIEGMIEVSNLGVLVDGLQKVVDKVEDLIMEIKMLPIGGSTVVATSSGSTEKPINGTTLYDPNDSAPIYVGMHNLPDASESDGKWEILKHTYSGSNVTRITRRRGAWVNRTTLF